MGRIGTRADTKQQVRIRRRGTFLGRSPGPYKKDLEKVQSRLVCLRGIERNVTQEMHGRGVRGRGATCPVSNGGRRSCGSPRHWRRVPARTNKQTVLAQKDRVLRGLATHTRAAKRQSFEGVSNAHKSHGWGGSVGRDRGKRHVQ